MGVVVYDSGMMKPRDVPLEMDYARFSKNIHKKTKEKDYIVVLGQSISSERMWLFPVDHKQQEYRRRHGLRT